MKFIVRFLLIVVLFLNFTAYSQESNYEIASAVFYNLENLFDTKNDSLIRDDDYTPEGRYQWDETRYQTKLNHLAKVLTSINQETYKNTPTFIGVCEAENLKVLTDLKNHPDLLNSNYGIIHEDSPDERGIDVALFYKKDRFIPQEYQFRRLIIYNEKGFRNYTRDQLVAEGYLEGEHFCFIVNHWPSRSGGEARSKPLREAAARLNKQIIDSVRYVHPDIKIIAMGDFNDNPTDNSFKKILKTTSRKTNSEEDFLYNPMEKLYKKGIGSLAYRDKWSLFDQFYFTSNLLNEGSEFKFWKTGVYAPSFLKNEKGTYKGYPKRTYAGGVYAEGYSDHFPIYMYLVRKK